ncbi:MAG: SDR family NAD(P)-dependent oxidoreductase [Steroidobacteraceae bacterium]
MTIPLRFDGQVALVTGGAAGIGRAHCLLLAERGAKVVVNGNYRPNGAGPEHDVVALIRERGGEAVAVNGSVADEDAVQRIVRTAIDAFGRLDILVNNAGIGQTTLTTPDAPDDRLERALDTHLRGTMRVTRAAWPHLSGSGAGRILNTGSACAFGVQTPEGYEVGYSVAKSALFAFTRQAAGEGAGNDIKVNLVLPWAFSPMAAKDLETSPLGTYMREKLEAAKVAAASLYLLHRDCPVTGQFISAAGGRVARVVFATARGYCNPDLTPEDVRDHWTQIHGTAEANGTMSDALELTGLQGEFRLIRKALG